MYTLEINWQGPSFHAYWLKRVFCNHSLTWGEPHWKPLFILTWLLSQYQAYIPSPATNNKNAAVTVFQFSFIFGCLSQLLTNQHETITDCWVKSTLLKSFTLNNKQLTFISTLWIKMERINFSFVFVKISYETGKEYCLLYKHQWNTRWAFAWKLDIFTYENNNMLSSHVKISPLLWLHNKSHLSHQKTIKVKWFGISLVFI